MMYNGLCHLTVSIEVDIATVISTLVAYEYLWMCIVEMASVIVSIYCECPAASLPCYGAIAPCPFKLIR